MSQWSSSTNLLSVHVFHQQIMLIFHCFFSDHEKQCWITVVDKLCCAGVKLLVELEFS